MKNSSNRFLPRRVHCRASLLTLFLLTILLLDTAIAQRGQTASRKESDARLTATKYFALIIGNDKYQYMNKLKTAVNDAVALERILRETYGFQTKLLLDANRDNILNALNEYRRQLDEQSRLIIYYAGHGFYDSQVDKAYWLPVDAETDNPSRWIIADDVTTNIKRMATIQVLIISDSCYSGMMRDAEVGLSSGDRERYLSKAREGRARMLIASGGKEPVADGGGGNHSVFAAALLKGLTNMQEAEFTAWELFGKIKIAVAGKSDQTPEYSALRNSGHDSGDFVFVKSGAVAGNKTEPARPPTTISQPQVREQPPPDLSTNEQRTGAWDLIKEENITVQSNTPWASTPIKVEAGQQVTINGGAKQINLGANGYTGPEGVYKDDTKRPVQTCQTGALLARIGEQTVCAGREITFTATSSGDLYLGINEGNVADNRGSFIVRVRLYKFN